ncbi:adipolin isoform X1 [Macaca nemestrina]|uniref:adipolin isoform X1 n=1 Tax=Macaca nemestrina TaxID=9545 RepID=UPI0039B8CE41
MRRWAWAVVAVLLGGLGARPEAQRTQQPGQRADPPNATASASSREGLPKAPKPSQASGPELSDAHMTWLNFVRRPDDSALRKRCGSRDKKQRDLLGPPGPPGPPRPPRTSRCRSYPGDSASRVSGAAERGHGAPVLRAPGPTAAPGGGPVAGGRGLSLPAAGPPPGGQADTGGAAWFPGSCCPRRLPARLRSEPGLRSVHSPRVRHLPVLCQSARGAVSADHSELQGKARLRARDVVRVLICIESLCQRHMSLEAVSGLESNSRVFTAQVQGLLQLQAGQYASVFVDNGSGAVLTIQAGSSFSGLLLGT